MSKGGLIIDVLAGPPKGEPDDAPADEELDEGAPPARSKQSPDALLSSIESQIAQLRGLLQGL